jgi:hypothetical protein
MRTVDGIGYGHGPSRDGRSKSHHRKLHLVRVPDHNLHRGSSRPPSPTRHRGILRCLGRTCLTLCCRAEVIPVIIGACRTREVVGGGHRLSQLTQHLPPTSVCDKRRGLRVIWSPIALVILTFHECRHRAREPQDHVGPRSLSSEYRTYRYRGRVHKSGPVDHWWIRRPWLDRQCRAYKTDLSQDQSRLLAVRRQPVP